MWKYEIIDNFFEKEDFKEIIGEFKKLNLEKIDSNHMFMSNNRIYKDGNFEFRNTTFKRDDYKGPTYSNDISLSKELITKIHARYFKILTSKLKEHCPEKLEIYDFSDLIISVTGKDRVFPPHYDHWEKILSVVIYLHPEKSIGTKLLISKNNKNSVEIEWKTNRALIFSRREGITWHSYKGNGIKNRICLVYNLCTMNSSAVHKIEGIYLKFLVRNFFIYFRRFLAYILNIVGIKKYLKKFL